MESRVQETTKDKSGVWRGWNPLTAALTGFKGVVVVIFPLKALQLDQVCGNLWKPDKNLPINTMSNNSMKLANQ